MPDAGPPILTHTALRKRLLKTVFKFLINPKNRLNIVITETKKTGSSVK